MDLGEKDKFGFERRSEDKLNYQMGSSSSPCPSVSMVDSFSPGLWNLPTNSQGMVMPSRPDMGGVFLPPGPGALPPSLSHFPTDSAFIERAARFSCFNGGAGNPFGASESLSPYSSSSKVSPRAQKNEMSRTDASSDASMSLNRNNNSGEPEFSGIGQEGTSNLGNAAGDSSPRGLGANKRKRIGQDMELEQEGTQQLATDATEKNIAGKQRVEQNSSTMATVKSSGKQATDSPEGSKDDIIHVRARRGQATNSHSLAERVRREKISERMKFLQDLVPGCSKVTGKAVMLDEIINYVQSLQKQVEFLSMKLATVNPRLDFNIEGLLSKDFLQPRGGPSSSMGFSHDMMHPQLHLPQQGLIPAGMADMAHPSDALRRALNAQLIMANGYKDTSPQMPNAWDDVLHNVIQMNFGATNPPLNNQDLSGKPRDGFSI